MFATKIGHSKSIQTGKFGRICEICNSEKSSDEFWDSRVNICEPCRKLSPINHHKFTAIRNRAIVREYIEESGGCQICGETDIRVLDCDHINRADKYYTISTLINRKYSEEAIIKELSKCRILCSNCHRRLTSRENNDWRHQTYEENKRIKKSKGYFERTWIQIYDCSILLCKRLRQIYRENILL